MNQVPVTDHFCQFMAEKFDLSVYRVVKLQERIAAYRAAVAALTELQEEIDITKRLGQQSRMPLERLVLRAMQEQPETAELLITADRNQAAAAAAYQVVDAKLARRVLLPQNTLFQKACETTLGTLAWFLWLHPSRYSARALEPARKEYEAELKRAWLEKQRTTAVYEELQQRLLESPEGRAMRQRITDDMRRAVELAPQLPAMEHEFEQRRLQLEVEATAIWRKKRTQSLQDAIYVLLEDDLIQQHARRSPQEIIREAERANEEMADELLKAGFTLEEIEELKNG